MAKRIANDTEYWQLKEDYAKYPEQITAETDKKKKKELKKASDELAKVLSAYEKKKMKDSKALLKKEQKLAQLRKKTRADKKVFFNISAIESRYYDFKNLSEKERNKLAVKKESMIQAMKKGMYVQLKDDPGIYQIEQKEDFMDGMNFVSSAKYGDVSIQDTALIIDKYYYETELSRTGHKVL